MVRNANVYEVGKPMTVSSATRNVIFVPSFKFYLLFVSVYVIFSCGAFFSLLVAIAVYEF